MNATILTCTILAVAVILLAGVVGVCLVRLRHAREDAELAWRDFNGSYAEAGTYPAPPSADGINDEEEGK